MSYNPADNAVLITSDAEGGSYELYVIPKDHRGDPAPVSSLPILSRSTVVHELSACCVLPTARLLHEEGMHHSLQLLAECAQTTVLLMWTCMLWCF